MSLRVSSQGTGKAIDDGRLISLRFAPLVLALSTIACAHRERAALPRVYQKAQLLYQQDESQRALALADQGSKRALRDKDQGYYWKFRLLKAEVLLAEGDEAPAVALIEGTIPALSGQHELLAEQWLDRGVAEFSTSQFRKSLASYQHALDLAGRAGSQSLVTQIELSQGFAFGRAGEVERAEADFRDALNRSRQEQDAYLEARALGNLGYIRISQARFDEAVDFLGRALPLFEKIGSRRFAARTLNNLGVCELDLGETEKALQFLTRANQYETSAPWWADQQVTLGRIGDVYDAYGDRTDALMYYQRALKIAQRTQDKFWIANWLRDLATLSIEKGDLAKAEVYNNQALALQQEMHNPVERFYPLLDAARLAVLRREPEEAERLYQSIISSAAARSGLRDPEIIMGARSGLAHVLVTMGHPRQAEAQWQQTLALIESNPTALTHAEHRMAYLSRAINFYQDYVDFLAAGGRSREALLVAESSRARLLSERLEERDSRTAPMTVAQLQRLAGESHTIFLSYWLAPRRSFLWMIGPTGLQSFTLPPEDQIAQLVDVYGLQIDQLRDPLASGSSAGNSLYQHLLAPVLPFIPRGSTVAIVPDGPLYNLNFGTIPIPAPNPHYWIEDATIFVAPSLNALTTRFAPPRHGLPSLLLVGDPVSVDSQSFPPLLNAKDEIGSIRRQFPSAVVVTGASAEPDAYRAARPERFSVIHFAAHATANREDPLDSAIILSPHDGLFKLYARDVDRIPIRADLVTISACQTAGTRAYAGEGLVGFAWAFLRAGARHVVAGLWEVDDQSTAQLMAQLYAALRRGSDPTTALHRAQLGLLESRNRFRKPYYWAPFELFADSLAPPTR
jgi:CHAT domain-containing protein/Tfp pilus assembly protein PilF